MNKLENSKQSHSIPDAARDYVRQGFKVVPILFRGKRPSLLDWQNLDISEVDLPKYFNGKPQNIGVLLGDKSGGLVDVDVDSPEAVILAEWFLPKTGAIFGRRSKPSSHWLYFSPEGKFHKFNDPMPGEKREDRQKTACIVEIRTNHGKKGIQTVFPPSVHESGEPIEWVKSEKPAQVSAEILSRAVGKLAAASILAKHWRQGIRQDLVLAIGGALLRHGFTKDDVKHFVKAICTVTNDEEIAKRLQAVEDTSMKLAKGENTFGFPRLIELTDKKVVSAICGWLEIKPSNQSINEVGFPTVPKPLENSLKPVQTLNADCLPKIVSYWLTAAAKVIGCPLDFLVLSAIVTAGSLIGARVRLKPQKNSDWFVVPNLFGGLVGLPSTKKSPALDETQNMIVELQAKAVENHRTADKDFEIEWHFFEKKQKEILKKAKSAEEAKLQIAELKKPDKPFLRRFQINDVTTAKLIALLSENPNGLLLFRDELSGWLRSLENDYEKTARAFILEVWKGGINYQMARADGRDIPLTSGTLSIIGGIQPSKLQKYVSEAYSFDNSDGFLQRMTLVFPDKTEKRNIPTPSDYDQMKKGREQAGFAYRQLAERDFHGNCVASNNDKFFAIKLNPEAQQLADEWKTRVEIQAESLETRDEAFSAYLYKIPKTCFAIMLIFHCLENIGERYLPDEVSAETAQQAIEYTEYLISHARRVFALGENQVFDLARKLLAKIRNGELGQGFKQREIMRKKWSGFRSADDVNEVLALLVEFGYLNAVKTTEGRPTTIFYIHPSMGCRTSQTEEKEDITENKW